MAEGCQAVFAGEKPWHVDNCDVFEGLRRLPASSVHCVVSSPPYLGLRDYGIPPRTWSDGSVCVYGLDPSIELYIAHTVELFEGFRRVLRDDGVIWWNLGDSYATSGGDGNPGASSQQAGRSHQQANLKTTADSLCVTNKMLIPHRVAIALQAAGWIIRQDVIWAKRSPMPESLNGWRWVRCRVKVAPGTNSDEGSKSQTKGRPHATRTEDGKGFDRGTKWAPCPGCSKCESNGGWVLRRGSWRCTTAHEYIFQIVKSPDYFCDGDAAQERSISNHPSGNGFKRDARLTYSGRGQDEQWNAETRNPRSVWLLSSEPFKAAHFATFPTELVRRCLVASCSPGGCCPACGQQYAPKIATERVPTRPGTASKVHGAHHPESPHNDHMAIGNRDPQRHIAVSRVLGYLPTCSCAASAPVPPVVLDPFAGSGTTIQVARHMGFRAIGFEQNTAYMAIQAERIPSTPAFARRKSTPKKRRPKKSGQKQLF